MVILTNYSLDVQLELSDFCHENGIKFILAETFGLFGFVNHVILRVSVDLVHEPVAYRKSV